MDGDHPSNFKHTTLEVYPESRRPDGTWTPKRAGVVLLDEDAEHTGVYIIDTKGGLWPARTVARSNKAAHDKICQAWINDYTGRGMKAEDRRG